MSNNILNNEEFKIWADQQYGATNKEHYIAELSAQKAEQILTKQFEEDRERFDNWKRYKIAILELHVDAAIWVYKGLRTTTKELYELYKIEMEVKDE